MKNITIAVNGRALSTPEPGGDVQAGLSLVKQLNKLPDTNVVVFGHKHLQKRLQETVVSDPWFTVDSQIYGLLWEQFVPSRYANQIQADVLFCPNGNGPVRETDIPVVVSIQSIFAYKGMAPSSYKLLQRGRAPRIVRCSDMIMTVSDYLKNEIVEHLDVPPEKIRVIYNGIDEIYREQGAGKQIDLPEEYILFVGSMNRRKNIETLIEAYSTFDGSVTDDLDLVVVGPEKKRIFEEVGIGDTDSSQIREVGFVEAAELKYIYEHASVFVFPSLFETFGLPPLEAMSCGTPVIASNRPALPEILGDAAHFVDPLDPEAIQRGIEKILTDDMYRTELVRAGHEQADKYHWKKAAKQCRALLRDAAGLNR